MLEHILQRHGAAAYAAAHAAACAPAHAAACAAARNPTSKNAKLFWNGFGEIFTSV